MHLNMSYSEVQKLPVRYRHWFIKRLSKHAEQKKNINSGDSVKSSQNEKFAPLSRIEEIINKKLG